MEKTVSDVLVEAIGRGAPKFNAGDIKGCANIYRQAAETALRSSNATEGQKMRLRAGLQGAGGSASDEAAAWALRNAFDDVLAGNAGVFNTKSAFAFSSSSQPNGASAGFNRGIHATQIVMGLISIVFSCSFIPTIVEGHFNDGGIGRPMRSLEWIYALIWFAIGVPMGLSAAAAGFFYFRGWKTGYVVALSLLAVVLILADVISVVVRSVSESFDYLNVLGFLWLAPMGVNSTLAAKTAWENSRKSAELEHS